MPEVLSKYDLFAKVGILRKWADCDWDQFEDAQIKSKAKAYLGKINDARNSGIGLYIHGVNGCGKTLLAMLILKDIFLARKHTVRAVTLGTLINLQTLGWYDKESRAEFMSIYQSPDFLLIEGVGKEHKSGENELGSTCLDTVLHYRTHSCKPTIITTCYDAKRIRSVYNDDVGSVLNEASLVLYISGPDQRPFIHEKNTKKYGF